MIGKRKIVKNKNVVVINSSNEVVISEESKVSIVWLLREVLGVCNKKNCGSEYCDQANAVLKELGGKKVERKTTGKRVKSKR